MASAPTLLVPPPTSAPAGKTLAVLMLVFTCVLWGLSFPTAQDASIIFERALPEGLSDVAIRATFTGWRYVLATLAYLAMTLPHQRSMRRRDIPGGLIVGLTSGGGVLLQLMGLRYTLPSTTAFITAMAVIFAPLAQMFLLRRPISRRGWASVAMALVGMILLAQSSAAGTQVQPPPFPYAGEVFSLAGSLLFTCQILAVDRWGKSIGAAQLTLVSLATVAVMTLAGGTIAGAGVGVQFDALQEVWSDVAFLWRFASLFLLATAIGMHLMNRYQPMISPAAATVIYCLEPVFGTLFSLLFGNESLTLYTIAGGGVILAAVLLTARE